MSKKNTHINSKKKNFYFLFPVVLTILNFIVCSFFSFVFFVSSIPSYGWITVVLSIYNMFGCVICLRAKKQEKLEREKMTDKAVELAITPFKVLMGALEAKDKYTEGHSFNVSKYAVMIGEEMGKTDDEILQLKLAGFVHDIGKVGIPDEILNKPAKLTPEEQEIMRSHTKESYKILKPIEILPSIKTIAKSHHENFDGTGYPDKLKGDRIHPLARILRVADSYDAITSKRVYEQNKKIPTQNEIITELESKKGKEYDPEVVDAMIRIIKKDKKFKLQSA